MRMQVRLLHSRQAQGIGSILVASMCRYRTIILGGASRLGKEARAWERWRQLAGVLLSSANGVELGPLHVI